MPTHAEAACAALHAGAALRARRRYRALSRISALVRRRAHPRAPRRSDRRRSDHRLSHVPRAVYLARGARPAAAHRCRLCRGAVPLPEQPLDFHAGRRAAAASISLSISNSSRGCCRDSSRCCSARPSAAWSAPSKSAPATSTAPRRRMAPASRRPDATLLSGCRGFYGGARKSSLAAVGSIANAAKDRSLRQRRAGVDAIRSRCRGGDADAARRRHLPANVHYAWPHASRRYLYVASSDSASGIGGTVGSGIT